MSKQNKQDAKQPSKEELENELLKEAGMDAFEDEMKQDEQKHADKEKTPVMPSDGSETEQTVLPNKGRIADHMMKIDGVFYRAGDTLPEG